jgi:single-strand DNA-binding protein
LAEKCERELKKGSLAYIEGKITHRKYNDKDNVERTTTEIVASLVNSLDRREKQGGGNLPPFPTAEGMPIGLRSDENSQKTLDNTSSSMSDTFQSNDDDLPF